VEVYEMQVTAKIPVEEWIPLSCALRGGFEEVTEVLLRYHAGSQVHTKDISGHGILYHAAYGGSTRNIKLLLEQGAPLDIAPGEDTSLHVAARFGYTDVVELLLSEGMPVNARTETNETPLIGAAFNGNPGTVRLLLNNGALIEARTNSQWTALLGAADDGSEECFRLLLGRGADLSAQNDKGDTALIIAAFKGHSQIVKLLLDNGVSVLQKSNDGQTALLAAFASGDSRTISLLLSAGADWTETDIEGNNALHIALENSNMKCVDMIIAKQPALIIQKTQSEILPLHLAAQKGHKDIVALLLDVSEDIDAVDEELWTPLAFASYNEREEAVKFLLDKQANINAKTDTDLTPLHLAAKEGHLKIVDLLISYGADVSAVDDYGATALHLAAVPGFPLICKSLFAATQDLAARDCYGRTALDWAKQDSLTYIAMLNGTTDCHPTDVEAQNLQLKKSIQVLLSKIMLLKESDPNPYYTLGKFLQLLDRDDLATIAFELRIAQGTQETPEHFVYCDGCEDRCYISGPRYVCKSCCNVDLCQKCMDKYDVDLDKDGFFSGEALNFSFACHGHEFLKVPRDEWSTLKPGMVSKTESVEDWLKALRAEFGSDPDLVEEYHEVES
jgi:ankyrin repeat protein